MPGAAAVHGLRSRDHRLGQRGQGLVELSTIVPVFLLLLLGMLEFGFAFDQNLTLEYATREGARVGSALANDGGSSCVRATTTVDNQIMAAVRRVLLSPGSRVKLVADPVVGTEVLIWKADAAGAPVAGTTNRWRYTGPTTGPTVDGQQIGFTQISQAWNPCDRLNSTPTDSIGVSLTYRYDFQTPLAGILKFLGGTSAGQLPMADRTVMALNPTN
jgi:Flp pilus assembly protein TadG